MAKQITQIRFGMENANTTAVDLISGDTFTSYAAGGIEQIGIQAIPGTMFYLNGSPDPIIIGATGIYELDVTDQSSITGLRFHRDSIANIANSDGLLSLLVDLVYREG